MFQKTREPGIPVQCPACDGVLDMLVNGRCPTCQAEVHAEPYEKPKRRRLPHFFSLPDMRYQSAYVWLLFVSALDVILTSLVLHVWEGREANPLAGGIIAQKGFGWVIAFKFGMMLVAVLVCEVVGRRIDRLGRRLSIACVFINATPVLYGFALLRSSSPLPDV